MAEKEQPQRDKRRCIEGILAQAQDCHTRAGESRSAGQRELADAQMERALKHYSDAIRVDPTHSNSYVLRARLLEESGDDERAEADLLKARQLGGGDS